MKIQYLNGGLGNQIFQYIFYRYYQIHAKDEIWLDNMKFFRVHEHNGYELERVFGLKPQLLSDYFEPDVWEYMVAVAEGSGGDLCQLLKDQGMDIIMVAEAKNFSFDGTVYHAKTSEYHPELMKIPGNVYFFGYWINKEWFARIRKTLMAELVFPAITGKENLAHAETIKTETCVSVHIRRGDFVALEWHLPGEFYQVAMRNMTALLPGATYLIFSDDIPWCKANWRTLGLDLAGDRLVFVTGNEGANSYIDMDLMSRCHGMVIANSAFSYFAALYNGREDKTVVNLAPYREV